MKTTLIVLAFASLCGAATTRAGAALSSETLDAIEGKGAPAVSRAAIDPRVEAILREAAAAYRNLEAFSATMETTQGFGVERRKVSTTLTFRKPGLLAAEVRSDFSVKRVLADGTTVFTDNSLDARTYTKLPYTGLPEAVSSLSRAGGGGVGLLPILLTSADAENRIIPTPYTSVTILPDETHDGEVCDVLAAIAGSSQQGGLRRYTFAFGKRDHLLRRLTLGPATEGAQPAVIEEYVKVTTQPAVREGLFVYAPAAGAVATEPALASYFDARLKPGASPLLLGGTDLAGKPVSLDDYKGKVLLIDFWAMWCGPCIAELPNVIAAYDKYHSRGFEILGISLDQEGQLEKLTKFIADEKMPWRHVYDGKYWQTPNAVAYGVRAIPFTVLIGRDGRIAAVSARGAALGPAIEAALAK